MPSNLSPAILVEIHLHYFLFAKHLVPRGVRQKGGGV